MKVRFACTACGKAYEVDDMLAGKRTKCRECGVAMRVPHPAIELGPADGPVPGTIPAEPVAFATAIPAVAVPLMSPPAKSAQTKPRSKPKKFDPSPRGPQKTPAWVGQLISFVLGCATTIAVVLLYKAAHPVIVQPPPKPDPDVAIVVSFEGATPPDAADTTQRVIAKITAELNRRNIHVKNDALVKCYAMIIKNKLIAIQPVSVPVATTAPAAFHEELLDVKIEFRDAADKQFWRSAAQADAQRGINLHPERLTAASGMTMDQALSLQQWKEAAERFSDLPYPDADSVRDAETAVAGSAH